jgi:hypothetical protein
MKFFTKLFFSSFFALTFLCSLNSKANAQNSNAVVELKPNDITYFRANATVRENPCKGKNLTEVKAGTPARILGGLYPVRGKCQGFTNTSWRPIVVNVPLANGGFDLSIGWVPDPVLDRIMALRNAQKNNSKVRVSILSGQLTGREGNVNGKVIAKLPNRTEVKIISVGQLTTVRSTPFIPTIIEYNGVQMVVDGRYLIAF